MVVCVCVAVPYREPIMQSHDQLNFIDAQRAFNPSTINLPVPVGMFLPMPPVQHNAFDRQQMSNGDPLLCGSACPVFQSVRRVGVMASLWLPEIYVLSGPWACTLLSAASVWYFLFR